MADFTEDDKAERSGGKYFDEGIHEVRIGAVKFDKTNDDREFAEFTVFGNGDDEEREAKTRFWFHTAGARGYSFGAIRNMFVHHAPEAEKEKTREKFNKIKNTAELDAAIQKVLVGGAAQVWLQVYQDGTYKDNDGNDKPSFNRDIYGYLPPEKKKAVNHPETGTVEPIKTTDSEGNEQTIADF